MKSIESNGQYNPEKKRAHITMQDIFTVDRWLTSNWDAIVQEKFNKAQGRKRLARDTGLNLSIRQFDKLLQSSNRVWPVVSRHGDASRFYGRNKDYNAHDRVRVLAKQVRSVMIILQRLITQLQAEDLCEGLPELNPDLISLIVGGRKLPEQKEE